MIKPDRIGTELTAAVNFRQDFPGSPNSTHELKRHNHALVVQIGWAGSMLDATGNNPRDTLHVGALLAKGSISRPSPDGA